MLIISHSDGSSITHTYTHRYTPTHTHYRQSNKNKRLFLELWSKKQFAINGTKHHIASKKHVDNPTSDLCVMAEYVIRETLEAIKSLYSTKNSKLFHTKL